MPFSFSTEQLEKLRRWRLSLETKDAKEWFEQEEEAERKIQNLLARIGLRTN